LRAWNTVIDSYFEKNDFKQCPFKHVIYMKAFKDELMMVALYVDNMIFMDNNQRLIDEFKTMMKLEFEMAGLKMMRYVRIFISQRAYI
jgi:Reverse transcriptase (RNA-dependent DNA polymerase)